MPECGWRADYGEQNVNRIYLQGGPIFRTGSDAFATLAQQPKGNIVTYPVWYSISPNHSRWIEYPQKKWPTPLTYHFSRLLRVCFAIGVKKNGVMSAYVLPFLCCRMIGLITNMCFLHVDCYISSVVEVGSERGPLVFGLSYSICPNP